MTRQPDRYTCPFCHGFLMSFADSEVSEPRTKWQAEVYCKGCRSTVRAEFLLTEAQQVITMTRLKRSPSPQRGDPKSASKR